MTEYNKKCAYDKCGKSFTTDNKKRIYCNNKCCKLAYIQRRYERDDKFRKKMNESWQRYGMDECPKCGESKRKADEVCRNCRKVDEHIDVNVMASDPESLFGDARGMVKIELMLAQSLNPEFGVEQLSLAVIQKLDNMKGMDLTEDDVRNMTEDFLNEIENENK